MTRLLSILALVLAVAIWGVTFSVTRRAVQDVPPLQLVFYRFALGTLALLLVLHKRVRLTRLDIRHGFIVGAMLAAGFAFQTWGLVHTTPTRSAFITGLSVLVVPLMGWLTRAETMRMGPILGALTAGVGLFMLFRDEAGNMTWGLGELITTGCALAFVGHILTVHRALVAGVPVLTLSVLQCAAVAVLSLPALLVQSPADAHFDQTTVAAVIGLGLVATPAFMLQVYAQRHLSSVQTAVVLALEPAMAAAFSVAVGTEELTTGMLLALSLLTLAVIVSEARPPARAREPAPAE